MIRYRIIRIIFIRTLSIFSRIITNLVAVHILIEEYLVWGVVIVLGLEGYMWDYVSVVDDSKDCGNFVCQELGVGLVAHPWAPEYMQFPHFVCFQLYLQSADYCQGSTQTTTSRYYLSIGVDSHQLLQSIHQLYLNSLIGSIEP